MIVWADYAAAYAAAGFIPIPVRANGKLPAMKGWQRSEAGTAAALARFAGHAGNGGVTFPPDLFALDVDTKPGKVGAASLQALEDRHGPLPATLEQRTASGGRHLIFRKPPHVVLSNSVGTLGADLDIRAAGGQIVVEPSTLDGKSYQWLDWDVLEGESPEIADAPDWLIELLAKPAKRQKGAIAEGGRNRELFRQGCAMRAKGANEARILKELEQVNSGKCAPPLPADEVATIARSAAAYAPDADPYAGYDPDSEPCEDSGLPFGSEQALAEAFVIEAEGKLRWTPGMDWMVNIGPHWERDEHLSRYTAAKQVCKAAASGLDSAKLAAKICAASTANALISLARNAPGIVTKMAEWDKHPMLLNTPDHVIDLETGRAVARTGLLFTQVARIAPRRMPTPAWEKFVSEVFGGDLEMVEFIQRMAGYALTGSIKEQKLFFLHGSGSNGKSVFLDVLRAIGGTYSHNLPSEALMTSKHESHPTMLASLHGKRLAISSEIEESAHWAESRIKSLTGDETLTARFMRQDFFTFPVTHKHIIAGNFKPRLKGDDFAMVRRLVLVPFAQRFEGARRDSNLPDKLRVEYPGILAWAIEGACKWAAGGLAIPAAVAEASRAYMAEQNDLEQWIAECCVRDPRGEAGSAKLYESFKEWKERNGEYAPAMRNFSQRLERMFDKKATRGGKVFVGLTLNPSGGDYYAASRGV